MLRFRPTTEPQGSKPERASAIMEYTEMEQAVIAEYRPDLPTDLTDTEIQALAQCPMTASGEIRRQQITDLGKALTIRIDQMNAHTELTVENKPTLMALMKLTDAMGIQLIGCEALESAPSKGATPDQIKAAMGRMVYQYMNGTMDVAFYECDEHGIHAEFVDHTDGE